MRIFGSRMSGWRSLMKRLNCFGSTIRLRNSSNGLGSTGAVKLSISKQLSGAVTGVTGVRLSVKHDGIKSVSLKILGLEEKFPKFETLQNIN